MRVRLIGALIVLAVASPASAVALASADAQPLTGQVRPATENPQYGPIQPRQLRGGLQDAAPADLLRDGQRPIVLSIQPAVPKPQDTPTTAVERDLLQPWIVALMALGLLGLGLLAARRPNARSANGR